MFNGDSLSFLAMLKSTKASCGNAILIDLIRKKDAERVVIANMWKSESIRETRILRRQIQIDLFKAANAEGGLPHGPEIDSFYVGE